MQSQKWDECKEQTKSGQTLTPGDTEVRVRVRVRSGGNTVERDDRNSIREA